MTPGELIGKIIVCPGVLSAAGKSYVNSSLEIQKQFLSELAEQCQSVPGMAQKMWGEELVTEIKKYSVTKT